MTSHDKNGRPYAKLEELKEGDIVALDDDFTCVDGCDSVEVHMTPEGNPYFKCRMGNHSFAGQADDGVHCVGVYRKGT